MLLLQLNDKTQISRIFCVVCFFLLGSHGYTKNNTRVHAYVVADAISGKIIDKKNADARCFPASLTKEMTLYLLFDALKKREINFNTRFKVSENAAQQMSSKLFFQPGEKISVEILIQALIIKSANDAAVVVAEGLGKSVENFVKLMNQTARTLGMRRTHFCNPSGIPNKKQKTTARDIAILSKAIFEKFPEYAGFFKLSSFVYKGHTCYTHNHLLNRFQGTDGIKTGYIFGSGYNISTSVTRYDAAKNPHHLLAVVIGKNSRQERDDEVVALLEPILIQRKAFFYEPDDPKAKNQFNVLWSKNRFNSKYLKRPISKNPKKFVLLRAPIYAPKGMNLLLQQYLEQKKDNAQILRFPVKGPQKASLKRCPPPRAPVPSSRKKPVLAKDFREVVVLKRKIIP